MIPILKVIKTGKSYAWFNKKNIIDLYLDGKTTTQIALLYHVNSETIRRILKINNIERRTKAGRFKKHHKINIGRKKGPMPEETKYKIGIGRRGKTYEELYGIKRAKEIKSKFNRKGINNNRYGKHWSEEHKKIMSDKNKNKWKDIDWVEERIKLYNIKQNKTEKVLEQFLKDFGFKFVGDGKFWIGYPPRNPDFINIKGRRIIEFLGNIGIKKKTKKIALTIIKNMVGPHMLYGEIIYIIIRHDKIR